MYFFFDTETTGLPINWDAPIDDFENWPRLVQIAWLIYDEDANSIERYCSIIQPEGFRIPADAAAVHGITTEMAYDQGVPLIDVLEEFTKKINQCQGIVAHNISFDEKIIKCELLRKDILHTFDIKKKFCTMLSSVNLCKLPSHRGYKWPKLIELYQILFKEEFEGAHDALVDVEACARCFWKLRQLHYL